MNGKPYLYKSILPRNHELFFVLEYTKEPVFAVMRVY